MLRGCEFVRVVTRDDEECFLLTKLRTGGNDGFELTVCHDGTVWTGDVTSKDLDELRSRLKMNLSTFITQTVEALTTIGETKDAFQYLLKRNGSSAEFVWKKHVPAEDITFQLGKATLTSRPDSTQYITAIFNHCIESMQELRERIHTLETDNERLSQERINALKRLEKCVVAKEELENEMYSKFSLVLNSKKEKIKQLKKEVDEGVSVEFKGDTKEGSKTESSSKRSRSPEIEKTLANSDQETVSDGEDSPKPKRQRGGKQSQSVTASSKADDSLDLGADEDYGTSTVSRSTRQRGRTQKKQTPSKPVLPRIGSNDSTPGSERKTRLRKGGSGSSNKSSDNIDADDLLEQL